jgi:hypothetical protein
MSASLSGLSASVTRILSLTGFPKELKTKDIQSAFAEWENMNGGFKIKWRDDTSLLIVFQDASVAKRAYLHAIAFPPPILTSPTGVAATIKPYDGPDAQSVIQNVNSRGQHNTNPSRSHNARAASISVFPSAHGRGSSMAANSSYPLRSSNSSNSVPTSLPFQHQNGREPSPTLPSLPSHPTLNALISSSLGEAVARDVNSGPPSDPAILATSLSVDGLSGGPRIGDPGKRMLGAALGVRHPSLGTRHLNGSPGPNPLQGGVDQAMREVQRAMGGLTVAE